MMSDAIRNFPKQFEYEPIVENAQKLGQFTKFAVCGMGGSQHASELLKAWDPLLDIISHRDYGVPEYKGQNPHERLIIASSYSGNTEESVDAFMKAQERGLPLAAIAIGGKLLELAKKHGVPYIQIPDTHIQPRSALGFSMIAMAKLMQNNALIEELHKLSGKLDSVRCEETGKKFAAKLKGKVPVLYSSSRNKTIAYNWKIKLNETGKIPAFYDVFPETNHNGMNGFDVRDSSKDLSRIFHFIFLSDEEDHPQVKKRMEVTKKLYEDRGLETTMFPLKGDTLLFRIFSSLLFADWTSLYMAQQYGLDAEQVPMVEELKKLIA
jgi:glucose/mannose-6-phosphate isomerase